MAYIFVNLKRFDVPRRLGGVCPVEDPQEWIESVIEQSVTLGLADRVGTRLTYLLPEAQLLPAVRQRRGYAEDRVRNLAIGSQGVFWDDIQPGGNFGAFTTLLPPTAARNLGCTWSIIGHSEERKAKLGLLEAFLPATTSAPALARQAKETIDRVINREVRGALAAGLDVLLCVGETAAERGEGDFAEQQPRIKAVLERQLRLGLNEAETAGRALVIGYEPVWAIGPGKIPPGQEYIAFVSAYIKETVKAAFGFEPPVVYGGGLKEENAAMLAGIPTIDGGLVALTRFTGEIGFEPEGLHKIVERYEEARGEKSTV